MGSRERVAEFLSKSGASYQVKEFGESTKNSALAAQALGCTVAEIAKSVVFVGDRTSVVIISGDKRVDEARLEKMVGGPVKRASPDEVRERTGYPIGGVPPFPHIEGVVALVDASIERFQQVWAAGGAPNLVFRMQPKDLVRLAGGSTVDVSESK